MRYIYILAALFFIVSDLGAQYPDAAECPHGIFIFLDNHIPEKGDLKIYRTSQNKDDFQLIGKVTAPGSIDELREKILNYEPFFKDLGTYTEEDILNFWEYISAHPVIDSLYPVNFPLMHLAAGTAFLDQTAEKGKIYRYRIEGQSGIYREGNKTTAKVSWPGNPEFSAPAVNRTNTGRNKIYIDWRVKTDPALYSFRVYRRQNMAGRFEQTETEKGFYSRGDTLILVVNDQSIRPRTAYEYYIVPLDRLANPGERSETALVTSFTQSDLPVITRFEAEENEKAHQIKLKWRISNPELIRSVSIFRSYNYDSAYNKIAELPPTDSTYTDHVTQAMENYYYYLLPEGVMKSGYPSARVAGHAVNTEIPDPPDNLSAESVKGGVRLNWKHFVPEVRGYYIYRDQGHNEELTQISGLIAADREIMTFVDSTEGLMGNLSYRYAVKAVNDGYVMSSFSDTSTARPGIATLVISPTNLIGGVVNDMALLVWDNMYQTNEFLLGYNVYRKAKNDKSFEKINQNFLPFYNNTYTDSTSAFIIGLYEYAVSSIDESGQESGLSLPVEIRLTDITGEITAPAGFRVTHGINGVDLIWAMDENNQDKVRIYRYKASGSANRIADLPAGTYNYTDTNVQEGKLYFYYLTTVSKDGKESEPSRTAGMRY